MKIARASVAMLAAAAFVFVAPIGHAQNAATGAVLGTITDPSGAVVAAAQIELQNSETGVKTSVVSSAQGTYAFPNVAPGKYSVTTRVSGFRTTVINDIAVQVNS